MSEGAGKITHEWVLEHYTLGPERADGGAPDQVCRRCGDPVDWLTKHAVERHQDPIPVVTPVRPEPPEGWRW